MATEKRYQHNVIIIEPHGKIVGTRVRELRETILPEAKAFDTPRILINFAHVHRMNSASLGVLMQAYATTKRKNGRIGVIHVGRHIKNLLVLSRLMRLFEHFESEAAAVAALSQEVSEIGG